jgi:hypothetical protein
MCVVREIDVAKNISFFIYEKFSEHKKVFHRLLSFCYATAVCAGFEITFVQFPKYVLQ